MSPVILSWESAGMGLRASDAPLGERYCWSAPTGWELHTRLRPGGVYKVQIP